MTRRITVLATLGCALASLSLAQAPTTTSTQMPARAQAAPSAPAGLRAEYVAEIDKVGKKILDLAEAIPAEKYSWRPAPGVRSMGEVFMHMVAGLSSMPTFIGGKRVEGVTRDSEKTITDKAKILEYLKQGLENAKETAKVVSDADLDKTVKVYGGREMTERQVLMLIVTHLHEHLGQAIAYARVNGIVPPWSKAE